MRAGRDTRATISLRPYAGRLRTLTGIARGEPLSLLFDTAAGGTVITPETAARLGRTMRVRVSGVRMGGEPVEFTCCGPLHLAVEGLHLAPQALVMDLARVLPPELPPVGGIASLHTFGRRALTIDLAGGRLCVEPFAHAARRVRTMARVSVRVRRELGAYGFQVFVEVGGRHRKLWFLLDSANLDDVLISPRATPEVADPGPASALTAGERREIDLSIAGLGSIRSYARERRILYDGVINAALLERMVLTVDWAHSRAWATWR